MDNSIPVKVGEKWTCIDDKRVVVERVYEAEIHCAWEEDGLKSVFPRPLFEDLFFPSYLEMP